MPSRLLCWSAIGAGTARNPIDPADALPPSAAGLELILCASAPYVACDRDSGADRHTQTCRNRRCKFSCADKGMWLQADGKLFFDTREGSNLGMLTVSLRAAVSHTCWPLAPRLPSSAHAHHLAVDPAWSPRPHMPCS